MKKTFKLDGLDCANCASKIERAIKNIDGVSSATVNFMTAKIIIEGDDSKFDNITAKMKEIVKKHEPDVVVRAV
ncbi:MAG TPA: heavy metal-associated domain-containing protein [Bacillota bacterium]|nr:heavy-metal-associated domain-containing protein [Clostridiales bacterium]HOQ14553.1 heavy metal-associated domain-containing protein [Bacillota bacterium]HPU17370.1 heavy metal-associated domain-containing protein [Bacillota bacterium]